MNRLIGQSLFALKGGDRAEPFTDTGFHIFGVHVREWHMANPKSRSDISDSKLDFRVQDGLSGNAIGNRLRELLSGRDFVWLSRKTGIPSSTLADFSKSGGKTENALRIAEALDTTVEYLVRGRSTERAILGDADETDWVMMPRYDLRAILTDGRREPTQIIPIRRPWLKDLDASAASLWLTTMPMTVPDVANEGDTIVCRDAEPDLVEGRTYIFARDQVVLVRRVTVDSQGIALISTDPYVSPIKLGRRNPPPPDEQIVPIARVLALLGIRLI